jgi:hypothetical protein
VVAKVGGHLRHPGEYRLKHLLASAATGLLLLATAPATFAQTTDGYHSIQVFPVVVDSASFAQRFNFTTPNMFPVTLKTKFFPGDGTAQAANGPLACNDVVVPANNATVVASLKALCPGLPAGVTSFGFLHVQAAPSSDGMFADIPVFAAFSRVSNPAGNGFSVEAFAAHTFTAGTAVINGLRRMASTPSSPAFQTNCFLANINQLEPEGPPATRRVLYTLGQGGQAWNGFVDLAPGKLVRLLDVFAAAGAPAGDYNDAYLVLRPENATTDPDRPGLMSFCTVQDNTSFGADFRVGKTAYGSMGIGSNDGMAAREWASNKDVQDRAFAIGPGNSANTHVVYFKHPDTVQCQLLDATTYVPLTAAAGLEMRAADAALTEVLGGDNATSTGTIYLGDKPSHKGYNNRYLIEVESNETNTGVTRPYAIYCSSGSGNTFGYDIIKYQEAVDRF